MFNLLTFMQCPTHIFLFNIERKIWLATHWLNPSGHAAAAEVLYSPFFSNKGRPNLLWQRTKIVACRIQQRLTLIHLLMQRPWRPHQQPLLDPKSSCANATVLTFSFSSNFWNCQNCHMLAGLIPWSPALGRTGVPRSSGCSINAGPFPFSKNLFIASNAKSPKILPKSALSLLPFFNHGKPLGYAELLRGKGPSSFAQHARLNVEHGGVTTKASKNPFDKSRSHLACYHSWCQPLKLRQWNHSCLPSSLGSWPLNSSSSFQRRGTTLASLLKPNPGCLPGCLLSALHWYIGRLPKQTPQTCLNRHFFSLHFSFGVLYLKQIGSPPSVWVAQPGSCFPFPFPGPLPSFSPLCFFHGGLSSPGLWWPDGLLEYKASGVVKFLSLTVGSLQAFFRAMHHGSASWFILLTASFRIALS